MLTSAVVGRGFYENLRNGIEGPSRADMDEHCGVGKSRPGCFLPTLSCPFCRMVKHATCEEELVNFVRGMNDSTEAVDNQSNKFSESLEKVPLGLKTPILLAYLTNFASIDLVADKLCSWCGGLALESQRFKEGPLVA